MVLAVLAMAALAYSVSQKYGNADSDHALLAPELADALNDIQSLRITGAGNTLIAELQKIDTDANGSNWIVANAGGYPANVGALRRVLLTLADARLIEQKTSNPDYYTRLGVADIDDPDATGLRIDIEGLPIPLSIIAGDNRINGDYSYVRHVNEAESWLINGILDPGRQMRDWLNRSIVELTADRIRKVTVTHPSGETLVIGKASIEDPAFVLEDMPEGSMLSYEGVLNTITGIPANLNLEEVVAEDSSDLTETEPVVARFDTFDGLILDITVYPGDEQTFLRVTASTTDSAADAEAQAINAKTDGWLYEVADYKIDPMLNHMDDLLKENPQ